MNKITSKADLMAAYEVAKGKLALRLAGAKTDTPKKDILICGDTGCLVSNSQEIIANLRAEVKAAGLENDVNVIQTGCFGFCAQGPIVKIMPDNVFYVKVTPEDAKEIVQTHIVGHKLVERLVYVEPTLNAQITDYQQMPFYKKQQRIALRNCGLIAEENIEEYIAAEGFQGLAKALTEMTPAEVVQEVLDSGICGRGGAGFPTGLKWKIRVRRLCRKKQRSRRFWRP